jgi:phosphoribosylformylglycinamidine synthase
MLNGFPSEKIGIVTSGEIKIDSDHWGNIEIWKEKYETAIENYLSKEEAGAALSSI